MASPEGESFYCITLGTLSEERGQLYAYASIGTAFLGFIGSLLQIIAWYPSRRQRGTNESNNSEPHASIIFWLAVSDYFACVLVIVKSVAFLLIQRPDPKTVDYQPVYTYYRLWGIPVEYVERYFYVCTYLWTFCYAVNMLLDQKGRQPNQRYYHFVWLISALLTGTSIFLILYERKGVCTVCDRLQYSYITSYWVPLALVMIGNPILYAASLRRYKKNLRERGRYTTTQWKQFDAAKSKFIAMILVFYFCWWTSFLVLGVSVSESCKPKGEFHGTLLIISAFFNPLQGLLNWFVYGKTDCFERLRSFRYYLLSEDENIKRSRRSSESVPSPPVSRQDTPLSLPNNSELIQSGSYEATSEENAFV